MTNPEPRKSAAFGATSPALAAHTPEPVPPAPPLTLGAILLTITIFGVPIAQAVYEKARGERVQVLDYLDPFEQGPDGKPVPTWLKERALDVTSAPRLRKFEEDLRQASFIKREALPWYQWCVTRLFGHGNEKAVVGRDDWLFFADDLGSAYGRGFLEPGRGGQEALAAIEDFKRQLDARGIDLLLIPSYSKEMLDPEQLSWTSRDVKSAVNPDLPKLYAELDRRKLAYVRMDEIFARAREQSRATAAAPDAPLALPRDTHWTPETMAFCARQLGERIRGVLHDTEVDEPGRYTTRKVAIEGQGDLVRMLGLPAGRPLFEPMHLQLEQVVDAKTGELVRSDPAADVLLMGDSLTKVFSEPSLGLGEGAGLAEHLMLQLQRPIDVIALPGGSATATREALARRPNGLAGKRLVVWQFGVRMLASGPNEWKLVKMPEPNPFGAPGPVSIADVPTDAVTVVGEIVQTSKTGPNFDYPFVLLVYEYKVLEVIDGKLDGDRVWVAFPAIVEGKDQPARSFKVGAKHRMKLDDVRLHFDFEQVTMFDDTDAGRVIHYPLSFEEVR